MVRIAVAVMLTLLLGEPASPEEPLFEGKPTARWVETLEKGDLQGRRKAAWALWNLGPAAAAGAVPLARALADEDAYVRDTSAKAIGKLGEGARAAVPVLTGLLLEKREEVRRGAAFALFPLGALLDAGHVPAIARALSSDDPVVRANAAGCLAGAGPAAKAAAEALTRLLDDEDAEAARWGARALAAIDPTGAFGHERREVRIAAMAPHMNGLRTGGGAQVFAAFVAALGDPDEEVRSLAANALGNAYLFAQPSQEYLARAKVRVFGMLEKALAGDESSVVREWAAYALGKMGYHADGEMSARAVRALVSAAKSRVPAVRCAVFQAFRTLGRKVPAAVPILLSAMGDPDTQVRAVATLCLSPVAEPTEPVLAALAGALEDWEPRGRRYAAMGLAGFGADAAPATGALIACLEAHEDRLTRREAARALGEIGPAAKAARPVLEKILAAGADAPVEVAYALCRLSDPPPEVALKRLIDARALWLLGRLGAAARPAVPAVVRLLTNGPPGLRGDAAYTLGAIGPAAKEGLPALEKAAKEGDEELRSVAEEAILKIRGE